MNPREQTDWLCERAREAGFDLCGVAPVEGLEELSHFPEWLARGYAGEMKYLQDERRTDPRLVLKGAQSLIVVALNYNSPHPYSTNPAVNKEDGQAQGWISRYAWGDDYHEVIKPKLEALVAQMKNQFPEPFEARAYVDTGPIIERVAAKYAGLGWLAKNTCLINQQLGSWLFLGVIITTLPLEPTIAAQAAPPPDLCGTCTRCLDACPTQAFPAPYVLDARRCISYLTIELRGPIPEALRPGMGSAVFGCDICQDVCPWNRKSAVTAQIEFQPRPFQSQPSRPHEAGASANSLLAPELQWLAALTPEQFSALFRKSAIKRTKWQGLVRNACIALGNSQPPRDFPEYQRLVHLLEKLASSEDAVIAEHARWALFRLESSAPKTNHPPAAKHV